MRSVVVVFPASMWAMMPMFRVLSSGVVRGMIVTFRAPKRPARLLLYWHSAGSCLPAIVGERLVRVRHAMRLLALPYALTALVRGVDNLVRELVLHALAVSQPCVLDQPAHGERGGSFGAHLDRNLIRRASDTA